jgi:phytoene dehydrogenase-like protein
MVSMLTTSLFNLPAKLEAGRLLASIGKIDPAPWMDKSASEWISSQLSHDEVRNFLHAVMRVATYVNAPDRISAGSAIEQIKKAFTSGVLYLDGGWQTLVDELARIVVREGVRVETGAKVEKVTRDQTGAVSGVRLADGRAVPAPIVLIASSPPVAARLVEGSESTSLARWADEAIPVRAACLDLALSRLPKPKATFALGIDRPLYLSVHSASARLAPEGQAMVHLAKYIVPEDDQPPESEERELEGLMDLVQPGWREALVYRDGRQARSGGERGAGPFRSGRLGRQRGDARRRQPRKQQGGGAARALQSEV